MVRYLLTGGPFGGYVVCVEEPRHVKKVVSLSVSWEQARNNSLLLVHRERMKAACVCTHPGCCGKPS